MATPSRLWLFSTLAISCILQTFFHFTDAAIGFLPVPKQLIDRDSLQPRDLQTLLRPQSSVDLHYLPEDGNLDMFVTVTAEHKASKYVMIENLMPLLSTFSCSPAALKFTFVDSLVYDEAKDLWDEEAAILFVTQEKGCGYGVSGSVFKTLALSFDEETAEITTLYQEVPLGDSPDASSRISIWGRRLEVPEFHPLNRRDNIEQYNINRTFDLAIPWEKREHIISLGPVGADLALYCADCTTKGKVTPYFEYEINTDVDIGEFFSDLGEQIVDIFTGKPKIPIVATFVPEAKLGLKIDEDIEANFNFDFELKGKFDISCSIPGLGGKCLGSKSLGKKLDDKSNGDYVLYLGDWTIEANATWGITIDLQITADMNVTVPVTAKVGGGEEAILDFINLRAGSTINPQFFFGVPQIEGPEPKICLSVAFGPSISVSIANPKFPIDSLKKIGMDARLDLPKVEACVSEQENVNDDCSANGPLNPAVGLDITIGAGLFFSTTIFPKAGNLLKFLYVTFNPYIHCWGATTSAPNNPSGNTGSPQGTNGDPTIGPSTGGNSPNGTDTGSSNGPSGWYPTAASPNPPPAQPPPTWNNYTDPDCVNVAPSPGGQPCGADVMVCVDIYRWACPRGNMGVVPPGTICKCNAFRHLGWVPSDTVQPVCTSGIYCFGDNFFGVCGVSGIEPPQQVAPGTVCRNGGLVAAADVGVVANPSTTTAAPTTSSYGPVAYYVAQGMGMN